MPHLSLHWRGARRRKRTVDRPMITSSRRRASGNCVVAPPLSSSPSLVTPIRSLRNITIRKLEVGWEEGKESEKISPGKNETFTRNPEQNKSTIKSHMRHLDNSGNADLTLK